MRTKSGEVAVWLFMLTGLVSDSFPPVYSEMPVLARRC